jgi:hypothetical protein
MKFFIATCSIILGSIQPLAASTCIHQWDEESRILVPISYELQANSQMPWIYQTLSPRLLTLTKHGGYHRPEESNIESGVLKTSFCIEKSELADDKAFTLDLGPRRLSLKARPIEWETAGLVNQEGKKITEGHMTPIVIIDQAKPDWAILRSAQILETDNGDVLIEAIIQNLTPIDLPIDSMFIQGVGRRKEGYSCLQEDPMQDVILEWDRILATGGSDGAWTVLGTTKVKIDASYSLRGICSSPSLKAFVPVRQSVPGNSWIRVTMRLLQLPKVSNARPLARIDSQRIDSQGIESWDRWMVGVRSDVGVWPQDLAITRQRKP